MNMRKSRFAGRGNIFKSLLAVMLCGGIALGIGSGAYGGGIDLGKKGNSYGIVSQISMETGKVFTGILFVVDSGHTLARDAASSGNFDTPYKTIAYTLTRVGTPNATGPNNGNLILILPGHTETVIKAAGLVLDVAGITIASAGSGSDRCTIDFTTVVGADMDVNADNITMYNILFTGGFDALTGPIDVNAADFSLINCEYRDVTGQAADVIVADDNADRLLIDGWVHRGAAADGGDSAILMTPPATGGIEDVIIRNFNIYGNFDTGAIENDVGGIDRINIHDGYIWTEGAEDLAITLFATSTGKIGPNIYIRLQDDAANIAACVIASDTHFMQPIEIVNANDEVSAQLGTGAGHNQSAE